MELRAAHLADLSMLLDIDGTIRSPGYVHVSAACPGVSGSFALEPRTLSRAWEDRNLLGDELSFQLKQVLQGVEEGVALLAELEGEVVGSLLAAERRAEKTLHICDLRIDWDYRRQGIGTALAYTAIGEARKRGLRALSVETHSGNLPAALMLQRCGFELGGMDTRRYSNHDLVRERVALFWYASLD